jgi:hypothetical protein
LGEYKKEEADVNEFLGFELEGHSTARVYKQPKMETPLEFLHQKN